MGTVLAQVGNGAYPSGARCLPQVGTFRAKNSNKTLIERIRSYSDIQDSLSMMTCRWNLSGFR